MQCHHNSLLIYGSLRTPTLDRFAQVTHVSTILSVVACLCMSTSGFLVFTSRTQGNILNNFSDDDTLINIARACVSYFALETEEKVADFLRPCSLEPTCSLLCPWNVSCVGKLWKPTFGLEKNSTKNDTC